MLDRNFLLCASSFVMFNNWWNLSCFFFFNCVRFVWNQTENYAIFLVWMRGLVMIVKHLVFVWFLFISKTLIFSWCLGEFSEFIFWEYELIESSVWGSLSEMVNWIDEVHEFNVKKYRQAKWDRSYSLLVLYYRVLFQ